MSVVNSGMCSCPNVFITRCKTARLKSTSSWSGVLTWSTARLNFARVLLNISVISLWLCAHKSAMNSSPLLITSFTRKDFGIDPAGIGATVFQTSLPVCSSTPTRYCTPASAMYLSIWRINPFSPINASRALPIAVVGFSYPPASAFANRGISSGSKSRNGAATKLLNFFSIWSLASKYPFSPPSPTARLNSLRIFLYSGEYVVPALSKLTSAVNNNRWATTAIGRVHRFTSVIMRSRAFKAV